MENLGSLPLATVSVAFNLPALYFVAAIVTIVTIQLARKKRRQRRVDRAQGALADAITQYFSHLDIEVTASCFSLLGSRRFITVVESEPIKKFRHSFIIEQALVRHLAKTTGQQVEKIYWRFPFTAATEEPAEAPATLDLTDPYHAEGPAQAWINAGYRVEDTSWESYEKAVKNAQPEDKT